MNFRLTDNASFYSNFQSENGMNAFLLHYFSLSSVQEQGASLIIQNDLVLHSQNYLRIPQVPFAATFVGFSEFIWPLVTF